MPELPEVETTRRGIEPHLQGQTVSALIVRQPQLRWPVPAHLQTTLPGLRITAVERRGKYLVLTTALGCVLIHLGMSGSLYLVAAEQPAAFHDHVDLVLANGMALRLTDPRRFGAVLWQANGETHALLAHLGPEPLLDDFNVDYLVQRCAGRKVAIKQLIMDSKVVVGVGNIYANEALFASGIDPRRAAGRISRLRLQTLVAQIKRVLTQAIAQGGTTLKDFVGGDGKPGYFKQELKVYGRGGQHCVQCDAILKEIRQGQRTTVYCSECQR